MEKEKYYLLQDFLSDIELYYSAKIILNNIIIVDCDEFHHLKNVMRHSENDIVYITDGLGSIYTTTIDSIKRNEAFCRITDKKIFKNNLENIFFCLPRLKNNNRFEFALEKSVELGITNFIIYESERTVAKGDKTTKWQKFLISAMKQSLRVWLPKIEYRNSINFLNEITNTKILLDQKAETNILEYLKNRSERGYFIFGPEGGLTNTEKEKIRPNYLVRLTDKRLRAETAIISTASFLSN